MKNNANQHLPRDLRLSSLWHAARRMLLWLALTAAFGALLYYQGGEIISLGTRELRISIYIAIMLLPFPLTGMPWKLIDRTFWGTVAEVEEDAGRVRLKGEIVSPKAKRITKKRMILTDSEGQEVHKKVDWQNSSPRGYEKEFHPGDRIIHLYGSPCTVVLPKEGDTRVYCAACGVSNDGIRTRCRRCRHTLMKQLPS